MCSSDLCGLTVAATAAQKVVVTLDDKLAAADSVAVLPANAKSSRALAS